MARTYYSPKRDLNVTVADNATDEEVRQELRRKADEHDADVLKAASARKSAREANPLEQVLPGPVTPEGQGVAQRSAQEAVTEQAISALSPEQVNRDVAFRERLRQFYGEEQAAKGVLPWSPVGAMFPTEGEPMEPFGEAMAETVESATIPLGLATGGVPGAVGGAVRAGAAKLLPKAIARLVGAGARTATGAGTIAAPMTAAGVLRGEEPLEAIEKGALMGILGEAGGAVVGKIAAPFARTVTPAGRELAETIKPTITTPGRMTSSWLMDTLENIAGAGIFGGGKMRLAHEAMETAADAGLQKFRRGIIRADDPMIRGLYKAVGKMPSRSGGTLADEMVDLRNVVRVAEELVAKDKGRNPAIADLAGHIKDLVTRGAPGAPGPAGFTAAVGPTPGVPPSYLARFEDVTGLLSHLKQFTRTKGIDPKKTDIALGAAKQLVKFTHRAAEQAAKNAGNDAFKAWRLADTTNRVAHAGEWVEDLMQGTINEKTGLATGKTLHQKLLRMDPNKTKHVPPEMLSEFTKFARVLANAQRDNPEGIGRMMIQLKQAAALGTVGGVIGYQEGGARGAGLGAAAGILGVPWVLSRLLTNPTTAKWLTTGLGSPTSRAGAQAIGKLTGYLGGRALGDIEAEEKGTEDLYNTLTP